LSDVMSRPRPAIEWMTGAPREVMETASDGDPGGICVRPMDLESDIDDLTVVMREAFDDDSRRFRGTDGGGPPGYDNGDFLRTWAPRGEAFTILCEGRIVGCMIVFPAPGSVSTLGNISIHPGFQDRGIGSRALSLVEKRYPDCRTWRLGTPEWAVRNHHFYKKNGYRPVDRPSSEEGFISHIFEKDLDGG
jgi:GNAT superfamily N-acetyltransferase